MRGMGTGPCPYERGSRAAECKPQLVGLSVVCFVLFCSVLFWFVFLIFNLFSEKQLLNQVKLGVAVLLCCALSSFIS